MHDLNSIAGRIAPTLSASRASKRLHRRRSWHVESLERRILLSSATLPVISSIHASSPLPPIAISQGQTSNGIWTGGGDGVSWSDPANWSNGVLPSATDDVVINAPGATVNHAFGNDAIHSLMASTPLTLSGGTLDLAAASTVSTFNQSGGILDGSGSLTLTDLAWSAGTQSGSGQTHITDEADLTGTEILDQREMDADGALMIINGGNLLMANAAVLNLNGATFSLALGTNISYFGGIQPKLNADVHTSFAIAGSSGTSQINVPLTEAADAFINGDLILSGPTVDLSGNWNLGTGSVVELESASVNLHTASVTGSGEVRLEGGIMQVNTPVSLPNLTQSGAVLDGSGSLTITNKFTWTGGTQQGTGQTHIASTGEADLTGTEILDGREMDADGALMIVSGGNLLMANAATLNLNSAIFGLALGTNIPYFGGTQPRINADVHSLITLQGSGGTSQIGADLNSNGDLLVNGTLQLSGNVDDVAGHLTVDAGSTLLVSQATSLTFEATSTFVNDGQVRVARGDTVLATDMTGPGSVSLEGGELTVNVAQTWPQLTQSGGILDGTAKLTLTDLAWSAGTQSGSGQTHITDEADLTGTDILDQREMDADGALMIINGSNLLMANAAVLNLNGATFSLALGTNISYFGGTQPKLNADVHTAFVIAGSSGTSQINVPLTEAADAFINGDLILSGPTVDLSGNWNLGAGSVVELESASVNLHTTSVTGSGEVRLEGGIMQVNTPVSLPNLTQTAGIVDGTSNLIITNVFTWSGGTQQGSGQTHIASTGEADLTGTEILDGREMDADGALMIVVGGNLLMANAAVLNLNSATFGLALGCNIDYFGGTQSRVNADAHTLVNLLGSGASQIGVDFNSNGDLFVNGTLQLSGNVDDVTGHFTINAGSTLLVAQTTSLTFEASSTFVNNGELQVARGDTVLASTMTGPGTVSVETGELTVNVAQTWPKLTQSGGILDGTASLTLTNLAWSGGSQSGSGQTHITDEADLTGTEILDQREMDADGALMIINGSNLLMANASVLNLNGATFSLALGTNISYFGGTQPKLNADVHTSFAIAGSSGTSQINVPLTEAADAFINGDLVLSGPTVDLSGNWNLGAGSVVELESSSVNLHTASVTGSGEVRLETGTLLVNVPVSMPNLTQTAGIVDGTSNLTITNVFTWSGGAQQGSGSTQLASGATLNFINSQILSGRTLDIAGTANLTTGTLLLANAARLEVLASGTFNIQADGSIDYFGGILPVFNNSGLFEKTGGTGTSQLIDVNNSGTVRVLSGQLLVNGDFVENPGSTFALRIGGTGAGQFGRVTATSIAVLDGTLNVTLAPGFIPGNNDTFDILDASAINGKFATTNLPAFTHGQLVLNQTAVSLVLSTGAVGNGVWTGAGDGINWSDPLNWSNDILPGPNDDVIINDSNDTTVIHDSGDDSVQSITASTPLLLSGGSLGVSNVSTITDFTQTGGTLTGAGDVTITSAFEWTGGTESGSSTTHIGTNVLASFTGAETLDGRRMVVDVDGAISLTGTALQMGNGASLDLPRDAVFEFANDSSITNFGGTQPTVSTGPLTIFRKIGGTGVSEIQADFVDNAEAFVFSGTLKLDGNVDRISTSLTVSAGATLLVAVNTSLTVDASADFENDGTLQFTSGTSTFNATFPDTGTIKLDGGTLVLNATIAAPIFDQTSGTLDGAGDLNIGIGFDWSGGAQQGSGVTRIGSNADANLTGTETLSGRHLEISGGAILTGTSLSLGNGADVTITSTGSLDIQSDASMPYSGGLLPTFSNDGLLEKSGGIGSSQIGSDLENFGTVRILSGAFSVHGDYVQHSIGTFDIQLAGATADKFGHLTATSIAVLDGILNVTLAPGYTPGAGDSFDILDAAAINGAFATTNLPTFNGGHLSIIKSIGNGTTSVILMNATNQSPVANPDTAATTPSISVPVDVLLNDFDPDNDPLTIQSFTQGTSGTVTAGATPGRLIYTPLVNGAYDDTFTYTITDGHGGFATGTVTVHVTASTGNDAAAASAALSSGLSGLGPDLGSWGSLFNFGAFETFLPVIGSNLSDLFGLGGSTGRLASATLPTFTAATTFPALKLNLQSDGFVVDFVQGDSGVAAGDLVEAHFDRDLTSAAPLGASSQFDDGTNQFLSGLLSDLNLDGLLNYTATLHLHLGIGVDAGGFFVTSDSGLELDILGGGTIGGATPAGAEQVSATGSASVNFQVKLLGPAGTRLHLGDASLNSGSFLAPHADGSASVSAAMQFSPVDLNLGAGWNLTLNNNQTTSIVTASGQLKIPGLKTTDNTSPDSIALSAVFANSVWTVDGGLDATHQHVLAGFPLASLTAHATINDTSVSGSFNGQLDANLENASPVVFTISAGFDNHHFDFSGQVTSSNLYIGLSASQSLLWVHTGTFGLTIHSIFGQTTTVAVTADADIAVILPQTAPPGVTPNGIATVNGFTGSLDSTGKLHLSANSFSITATPALSITGGLADLTIDPSQTAPNTVIASLLDLIVEPAQFSVASLPTINLFQIRRNGFDLVAHVPLPDGNLAGIASLTNFAADLNLHYTTSAPTLTGSIMLSANSATLFPGGATSITATGLSGSMDLATGALTLTANSVDATLGDVLNIHLAPAQLNFGFDATVPVFSSPLVIATITGLSGLNMEIDNLNLTRDGKFTFSSIQAHSTGILQQFGLAGILPFDITDVRFDLLTPGDLSQFTLTVVGNFDFSGLNLPFTPIVQIGTRTGNTFSFRINTADLKNGIITPVEFGPITLGFSDLHLDPVVLGGTITLGGFQNGHFVPSVGGMVNLSADLPGFSAAASVSVSGSRTDLPSGATTFDIAGQFTVSFNIGNGLAVVQNAQLPFDLKITNTPQPGSPINLAVVPTLSSLGIDSASFGLGDLVTLTATGAHITFAPVAGQPFIKFDSLGVAFKQGIDFLSGWSGTANNFGIGLDGSLYFFNNAGITIQPGPNSTFGLPPWIPFHATKLGIEFKSGFLDSTTGQITGATRITDPTAIGILFSGGLFAAGEFPFNASVQNVELDLDALRHNRFPITSVGGAGFGLEPVTLGPITVAGFLNIGTTDAGNFYLDIGGEFGMEGLGDIGGRLIVSQFGPVAGQITVPLAVPLGPTGLVLTGVTGGIVFGQKPKTITDASQLTRADIPGVPPAIDATTLAQLVDGAASQGTDIWHRDFTIALSGEIIALEAPGLCDFQVGLVLNTGGQFAGFGTFNTLGIPFADALMLLDLTRTDPRILAHITSPNPGNPLGFILPDQGDLELTFDAQGLTEGLVFAFQTFLQKAVSGTESVANGFVGQLLDAVAANLQANRTSDLAQKLLAGNPNATIDRTFLINRLLALLPGTNLTNVEAHLSDAGDLIQSVLAEVMDAAGKIAFDPSSLSATESQTIQGVLNLIGGGAQALGALVADIRDAALAGASAFDSVFNPFIDISGSLQPVVLGIPFGPPTAGAHLGITKNGLVFGANLSPSGLLDQYLQSQPVINTIWGALKFFVPIPFALAGTEHLSANVELPLPGSFATLALGQFPTIDPNSGDWLVSVSGAVAPFGIQLASLTGAVFSGGNKAAAPMFQVAANFSDAFNPVDPTRIIVSSQAHLDLIRQLGGTILNSQVLLPSLLMDPGNTFAALPPLPTNPLQLPGYIADLATILSSYEQLGRIQLYIPSPETLLQFNFTSFDNGGMPRIQPSAAFLAESPGQQQADLQHLIDSIYLEGVLDGKILGIQLVNGTINSSPTQFTISGAIPWLLNLQTSFGISFVPRPISIAGFVSIFGRQPNGTELNPDGTAIIQLPVVSATASIDTTTDINAATDLASLLQSWGLPAQYFISLLPTGGAQFRAYSPAFDPTSSDPLLRNGGIEFDSNLQLVGLLKQASFKFAITPPTGSALTPDFVATAQVTSLGISGFNIQNATVSITKSGNNLSVFIDGTAQVLGTTMHVHGTLNPDLTGTLSFDSTTNGGILVDGFTIQSSLIFTITRHGGKLTGVLSYSGAVTLPSWLSAATGQANAQASGTIASDGTFDLSLRIANFAVGSGTGISIVSATGTGAATFDLIHTTTTTTVSISGGIRFGAATGLPLLGISGSLSNVGVGNLTLTFGNGLNLGGFNLIGGATLAYAPSSFDISVNAHLTVGTIFTNAAVTGAITQNGIQQLTVSTGSLNLNPLTVHSSTLSLNRIGIIGLSYRLHAQVVVDITDIITNATITGDLDSSGLGTLALSATQVTIFGFTLTNGSFSVTRSATGTTFSAAATLSFLGQTITVSTPTPLTLSAGGATGQMALSVAGGAKFGFDGWSIGGTLALAVTPTSASLTVTGGSLSIPLLFTNLPVSGSLNSAGLGTLSVGSANSVIQPGGASSPFTITGTYTLARTQTGTNPPVTTFSATNTSFTWTGVTSLTIPTFTAASNGQFNVVINPVNLSLGGAGGLVLQMGTVSLIADVGGLNLRLHFGGASVSIPNVATGGSALAIPAFDVNTTGNFSITLVSTNLTFGAVRITGKLVFQRQAGVFSLAINGPSAGVSAQLVILAFDTINLNSFVISSNGTFSVLATDTQLGPNALSIHNASITVAKTGAALNTFSITIVGGKLFLPIGNSITLPTLTISSAASFSQTFSVPSLNFGPAFNTTGAANFTLSLSSGVLDFSLSHSVGLNVLAGSVGMTLQSFDVASDGTFTGSVTGKLNLLGFQLASATFDVSLVNGVATVSLPASRAATLDLGFIKVKVSGFVRSNGQFSFTGSATVSASALGVSASGTGTFTLSDTGFSGSFFGSFSALGVNLLNTSGTINSSGLLTVTVPTPFGPQPVSLQL